MLSLTIFSISTIAFRNFFLYYWRAVTAIGAQSDLSHMNINSLDVWQYLWVRWGGTSKPIVS